MRDLTTKDYWDQRHSEETAPPRAGAAKRTLKRLLGPRVLDSMHSYSAHVLWTTIYRRYLPAARAGERALEIGSAPGDFLVSLRDELGYEPFGVEYSEEGVRVNRELFAAHGIDPAHVTRADFFDDDVLTRFSEAFDVVLSRGFIEHFSDPREVVARHVRLLRPGGTLLVSIPNLRGLNGLIMGAVDADVLRVHNLSIMDEASFRALFAGLGLTTTFVGYSGTFNLLLFEATPGSAMRVPLEVAWKAQLLLNVAFRGLFGDAGHESPWTSPYLVYVGVKGGHRQPAAPPLG
jgi:SAM-dependent methyltransferase